ncbi:hypothetical protein [Reticulibacter mediterranei]|nr:hypothetical protein [Reticulibacter mediterranei]
MPKKSASARSGAQRKPKAQKSIELVRPTSVIDEQRSEEEEEAKTTTAATAVMEQSTEQEKTVSTAPKGSAAAKLAARRQAAANKAQRNAAVLITPEHFSYVQKDLITVAILAVIMIAIIIGSYYFLVVRA